MPSQSAAGLLGNKPGVLSVHLELVKFRLTGVVELYLDY
jgi:hypothetical protein